MKKIITIGLLILMIGLVGCGSQSSVEQDETRAVKDNMQEMSKQVGMPFIDDFFEKKMAKQIFELRDNAELITYAYTTNLEGKYIYLGKCIGFGLPYSVQYTNPMQLTDYYSGVQYEHIIPQADPNGLYMPEGLSATWLMLINEETGESEIIYSEPQIVVTQSKLPKRLVADWSMPSDY